MSTDQPDIPELCKECEAAMEKGLTKILLAQGDAAIVFRNNGGIEIFISEGDDDRIVSDSELLAVAIATRVTNDSKFVEECLDHFDKTKKDLGP
jgi:hypothetical protein